MKNRDIPLYAVFDLLYIIVSAVAARLFSNIAVKFVDLLVELSFFSASIIRVITLSLFFFGLVCFFAYKSGYREARFDKVESAAAASSASLLHFLLGLLFAYTPWLFGATKHIAGFLAFGINYNDSELVAEIPMGILVAVGLLHAILTVGFMVVCHFLGFRKRLAHREALVGVQKEEQ